MSAEIKLRVLYVLTRKNKADDDDSDLYVGSTSYCLRKRLYQQTHNVENVIEHGLSGNNRLYVRMREVGIENWEILPLLSRMCGKKEVYEVEKKWIGILKADLKLIKYRKANREKIQDYFKKIYNVNSITVAYVTLHVGQTVT